MTNAQNYGNHTRFDPAFHFVLVPVLMLNVLFTLIVLIRYGADHWILHAWLFVLSIALLGIVTLARIYALRVQDRVIRLEERIRYLQVLTPEGVTASQALSMPQIVALRFASDAELPMLLERTAAESLPPKGIKQSITSWRPDTHRV